MLRSVKSKISAIYVGLVLTIAILGIISIVNMVKISRSIDSLIEANYNSIRRLNAMYDALDEQNIILLLYIYGGDRKDVSNRFYEQADIFNIRINGEASVAIIPEEIEIVNRIRIYYKDYLSSFDTLISKYDINDPSGLSHAISYNKVVIDANLAKLKRQMIDLYDRNEVSLFARRDQAVTLSLHSTRTLLVLFFISIIVGLFLSIIYTNRLLNPLFEITQTIRSVGKGGIYKKTNIKSKDEFGLLANEFNNMTQRLEEFEKSTMGSVLRERNRTIAIVRSITEPLIILDSNYYVLLLNESFERQFGITIESASGKLFEQVICGTKMEEYIDGIQYKTNMPQEIMISDKEDGFGRYYNISLTPISDNSGLIIAIHDITETKKLDKAKNDFVATVSHEFKTPITSIIMGVDLLASAGIGSVNKEQQEVINVIKEDSERLSRLVYDLLELSKIESSLTIYNTESFNISDVIEKTIKQFQTLIKRNHIKLEYFPAQELPPVIADKKKITWVLNNLLSNAVKFTESNDKIAIRTWDQSNMVYISVSDTGTGISKEMQEHLFERYIQVKSYEIEMRGSGIGLALSKEIMNALGGDIWCVSEENYGSIFTLTLKADMKGLQFKKRPGN